MRVKASNVMTQDREVLSIEPDATMTAQVTETEGEIRLALTAVGGGGGGGGTGGGPLTVTQFASTTNGDTQNLTVGSQLALVNVTAGTLNLNLPTAVGIPGVAYKIRKVADANTAHLVNVLPAGGQTIDGIAGPRVLSAVDDSIGIMSDGTNWQRIDQQMKLSAKGSLFVGSGPDTLAQLPIGVDGRVLTADSTQPFGLRYGTVGSGTVSSIASAGGSVTITGGAGPNVNLEVAGATAGLKMFNILDYGAIGDTRYVNDGAITSGSSTLTSATAAFTAADIGKQVAIQNALTSSTPLVTTITAVGSPTSVTVGLNVQGQNAGHTISGTDVAIGTINSTAIQSCIDAAHALQVATGQDQAVFFPPGYYMLNVDPFAFRRTDNYRPVGNWEYYGVKFYSHLHLTGLGLGGTIVQPWTDPGFPSRNLAIGNNSTTDTGFSVTGLRFDGCARGPTTEEQHFAVYVAAECTNFDISHNEFLGFQGSSILLSGRWDGSAGMSFFTITYNNLHHNGHGQAITCNNATNTDYRIEHNDMWGAYTPGGAEAIIWGNATRASISYNRATQWGSFNTASGNLIDFDIIGNYVSQGLGSSAAFNVDNSAMTRTKIIGNIFDCFATTSNGGNERGMGGNAGTYTDVLITKNTFRCGQNLGTNQALRLNMGGSNARVKILDNDYCGGLPSGINGIPGVYTDMNIITTGVVTIPSGSTGTSFSHGLGVPPQWVELTVQLPIVSAGVIVKPTNDPGVISWALDNDNGGVVHVVCQNDPGASGVTITWKARV